MDHLSLSWQGSTKVLQSACWSYGAHYDGYLLWIEAIPPWECISTSRNLETQVLHELKKCSVTRNLSWGKEIHAEAEAFGILSCKYIKTALLSMYAKCGSMADARKVFDTITDPDVVSWSALIQGYAENGEAFIALQDFARMKSQGCAPNLFTYVAALKACISLALSQDGTGKKQGLLRGKELHAEIGSASDLYVQSTLIDMYAKCGSMVDARKMFENTRKPDLVSWTALILGYADNGEGQTALDMYARMKSQGFVPDRLAYIAALKACSSLAVEKNGSKRTEGLECGKKIHQEMGSHSNILVQNTLIDMYGKCGSMAAAHKVFNKMRRPDIVSWTVLMMGYADNGYGDIALDLFVRMLSEKYKPVSYTFVAAIKACISLADENENECLERGREIHRLIVSHECSDVYVKSSLIDMYAKLRSMTEAHQAFDRMKHPNVVSWTVLISGYVENGELWTALDMFARMNSEGYSPNIITYVAALKACGSLGALESGRRIHTAMDADIEADHISVSCVVDFYAKCGSMVEAHEVFSKHPEIRDQRIWTALLAGYSRLGDIDAVLVLFQDMEDAGFQPNGVTFLCVLSCCSHAGLVQKASQFFEVMHMQYGISPGIEHYNCMVDILGRSNKLDDAVATLRSMPWRPNNITWLTLLGACRTWKNARLGRLVFESLQSLNDSPASLYTLMAHIGMEEKLYQKIHS